MTINEPEVLPGQRYTISGKEYLVIDIEDSTVILEHSDKRFSYGLDAFAHIIKEKRNEMK